MNAVGIIIDFHRPVAWAEIATYFRGIIEDLDALSVEWGLEPVDPDLFLDLIAGQQETVLKIAAATLGVPEGDIYTAVVRGRVQWFVEITTALTDPVYARLDGGEWILQPGIIRGVPLTNPPEIPESSNLAE